VFRSDKISILGWMVLLVLLTIPVVNVIFVIWILIRRRASQTVKNFFIAYGVFYLLAWLGLFNGVFENLQGLFG
jgi:hypothetical protein